MFQFFKREIYCYNAGKIPFPEEYYQIYKIAELCPDIQFWLIGDGKERKNIEDYCKKQKIKTFGCRVKDNITEILLNSDIYISTARWEGMPLSVIEAMACGLPVVASNVVGNQDTIVDGKFVFFL